MVALRVEGVSKRYGRLSALDRVSLSVASGEIVAVVGENGAGKTTLVRCIAGDVEPDEGRVDVPGPCGVVWQDLGLCDDLDVVANVFLGRERGRLLLAEARMLAEARRVLDRFGSDLTDLRTPVEALSRGERQEVALARALATGAQVLVLDEPTASLSVVRRTQVVRLLRQLRDEGRAILLVSHDLDETFAIADRIVVLRHGRVVASVSAAEVHADDVTALMSGIETESMARRQLNRLTSLVAQLSAAGPAASLPIVLSATAVALGQDMLCIHLRDTRQKPDDGTEPVLRRAAAVGLPGELAAATAQLPVGAAGGPVGMAAHLGELVVAGDIRDELAWAAYLPVAAASGVRSVWSAPIVGVGGVLGTITGFGRAASRLDPDLAELVSLYAGHAAQVIEREQLLAEAGEAAAARRSQALQRELLQQLSHELRTPLTAIHGYASTLQQPDLTWDAAATGRFLAAISAESERMERLVGDLLDSSAIESGLLWLRRDWTDLRLVLAAARDCVPPREQISLTVAPDLEPVWADHDRLQQVFVNLLENAVRHGGDGKVEVEAQYSPVDSTRVEVLVRDGGPGVPPELAEQIFEPRVRGKGGTGAGLGLAIARGIAEAHGGSCRVLPGPVTTFQVLLPVEPVELEARDG